MPQEPARRHAPPEVRRAQILEGALGCFARQGYHATTVDQIALAAGLSKGSLYWHFGSKEEIFLALLDGFTAQVVAVLDEARASGRPVLRGVEQAFRLFTESLLTQGPALHAWLEFLAHPVARERFAAVYRESRERLAELLREGVARGEVRDLPPEGMAAALVAAVEGLLLQALVDPGFDPHPAWPVVWQGLEEGFAA